jgi:DNA-binding beta-propeller fold protein YncE
VYAPDATGNQIYELPVAASGSISLTPYRTTGSTPHAVALTPDGAHLYVALGDSSMVGIYAADPDTGLIQSIDSVATPTAPTALAITPSGGMLFAANDSGSISGFTIGLAGALTSPIGAGASIPDTSPRGVAVSPDGARLFVTYSATDQLAEFAIGPGATLQHIADISTGTDPGAVVVSPDGSRVYVANSGSDDISAYQIAANGAMSAVVGSPYTAGNGAAGIAISPDGSRALVANPTAGSVRTYVIGPAGELSPVGTTTNLDGATALVVSPDSQHAYVGGTGHVWAFDLGPAGTLTASGPSVTTSGQHTAIAISPDLAPVAKFIPAMKPAGSASRFDGTPSYDRDGIVATYTWDFGDGTTGTGTAPSHTYAQAGTYTVRLTVTDDEACSTSFRFTGQTAACAGGTSATATKVLDVDTPPVPVTNEPPCVHDGNDGFCGTPDEKAPQATVLGLGDGSNIQEIDAPDELGGIITSDPSSIKSVMLRFTKAAGFKTVQKVKRVKRCRKVRRKGSRKTKRVCRRVKKKIKAKTRIALCDTISPGKSYFVRKVCQDVAYVSIGGDATFRYSLPVALGIGVYTVDVLVTDNAGNTDVLEQGRNELTFKVVKTASNQSGGGTVTSPTTTPSQPIDDTGSPFG